MTTLALTELETLAIGLISLVATGAIASRAAWLVRLNVPLPVLGGVIVAIVVAALRYWADTSIQFGTTLTDFFLLVFFTTVGLSAKLATLKAGGRPLAILCAATIILLIAQNAAGVLVATMAGAHPFYGVLIGSVSFVGGPGTAAAWAKEALAMGLERAPEVAVAAATLAVVVGAFVSGPITIWLIRRRNLRGPDCEAPSSWATQAESASATIDSARAIPVATILSVLLLIVVAVVAGGEVNAWARGAGIVLPGFLTAMLVGVAITNLADAAGLDLDLAAIEKGGEIALQIFLVLYLMSLKLWTLHDAIGPLIVNVVVQIGVAALIGILLLFRWLGKDYDAAVTVGGFLGFGLSSMPVAIATMDGVALRYGPSPKAFLLIVLAGSFFVDLANAFIVKAFLMLPWLH